MFYEAYPPDIKRIALSVSRKMSNFKVKVQISRSNIYFFLNRTTNKCNTSISSNFDLKIIFGMSLMIHVHLQSQKVNFKVKLLKM